GCWIRAGRARERHGGLDQTARGLLRRRRAQADLRARQPGGRHAALVVARPHRTAHAHRRGRGAPARHHRRPRPARRDVEPPRRARLEVGFHLTAHDYLQALRLRTRYARVFVAEVFAEVDALLAPVIPEPAPALDAVKAGTVDEVVMRMGRFSRLTRPFNGLGLPALSVPCGFSADGRPLALQVVGRPFDEATVLRLGHAYER